MSGDLDSISTIHLDPLTNSPNRFCYENMLELKITACQPQRLGKNCEKLRFVCISDTHGKVENLPSWGVPAGDVLLHAGDFTMSGSLQEVREFNEFLRRFPHKYKVVIAGNHERSLDETLFYGHSKQMREDYLFEKYGDRRVRAILTNCIYLEDEGTEIEGIRIYGSPWTVEFGSYAFSMLRGQDLLDKWDLIPDTVDVLVTHGPPVGAGDLTKGGNHVGCVDLMNTVQKRVKPKFHVFGHIHEGYGVFTDGTTTFINASICTRNYMPTNAPVVFDIKKPGSHKWESSITEFGDRNDPDSSMAYKWVQSREAYRNYSSDGKLLEFSEGSDSDSDFTEDIGKDSNGINWTDSSVEPETESYEGYEVDLSGSNRDLSDRKELSGDEKGTSDGSSEGQETFEVIGNEMPAVYYWDESRDVKGCESGVGMAKVSEEDNSSNQNGLEKALETWL